MQRTTMAVLLSTALANPTIAADFPKEGRYDYIGCWSGVSNPITFSKTHSASSFELTGSIRSNVPGGLFDKAAYRCVGSNANLDGKQSGMSICEAIDSEGDRWMSYFSSMPDGKLVRETVTGTGKYAGMSHSGSVQPLGPFPTIKAGTFQGCNHQTGTYKLK